jgi:hypothetical protein
MFANKKAAAKSAEKAATAAPADVATRGAALDEQLAEADKKGKPDDEEAVRAQQEADAVGRQVRGW